MYFQTTHACHFLFYLNINELRENHTVNFAAFHLRMIYFVTAKLLE